MQQLRPTSRKGQLREFQLSILNPRGFPDWSVSFHRLSCSQHGSRVSSNHREVLRRSFHHKARSTQVLRPTLAGPLRREPISPLDNLSPSARGEFLRALAPTK